MADKVEKVEKVKKVKKVVKKVPSKHSSGPDQYKRQFPKKKK